MNSNGIYWKEKRNSEDWDLDEGKESGITPKFDCVKSFMDTDVFRKFSTKYGLDSEIVASFCESFATKRIGPPCCKFVTLVSCYPLQITFLPNYLLPIISDLAENTG